MTVARALAGLTLAALPFALWFWLRTHLVVAPVPAAQALAPAVVPSTDPADPLCIHEACVDRPARLVCVRWWKQLSTDSSSACAEQEIIYEHHCTCDRWLTVEQDGGAP